MVEKTRSNSTSSLNVIDDKETGGDSNSAEIEQLRDENELLTIKVNKLKYDLKLRDTTVDDLKVSIFIQFEIVSI